MAMLLTIPTIVNELQGNPKIVQMGVAMPSGAMDGKETRFGTTASAFWSISTTVISTRSVNSMPVSGLSRCRSDDIGLVGIKAIDLLVSVWF